MTVRHDCSSAEETLNKFDSVHAATKYASSLVGTRTDLRERRCLRDALSGLSPGTPVLDLPCGTGRLLPLLVSMGLEVTAADSSSHMVEQARAFAETNDLGLAPDRFHVANIFETPFEDGVFGAVVCNRLLHHFREAETRRLALAELRRICRGPIVASFFCNLAVDALVFHAKRAVARTPATDRIPIGPRVFTRDAAAAGLETRRMLQTRPGVSRQWYAVLDRAG